jgi:hypothetical protein
MGLRGQGVDEKDSRDDEIADYGLGISIITVVLGGNALDSDYISRHYHFFTPPDLLFLVLVLPLVTTICLWTFFFTLLSNFGAYS